MNTDVEAAVAAMSAARRLRGQSERTIDIDAWLLRAIGKHPADATLHDLEQIVLRNRSQSSRSIYARRLRSIYQLLRDTGYLPDTVRPDAGLPKIPQPSTSPRPFTPAQLSTLLRETQPPYRDAIILAAYAGLRACEIVNVTGADLVDGVNGPELHIIGKGRKEAWLPAHPRVVEVFDAHRTLGRLFPSWNSARTVSNVLGREIRRVLGTGSLHQCRHSFATQILAATGDLAVTQQLMRHSSPTTTMIYAQVASSKTRAAVELLAG